MARCRSWRPTPSGATSPNVSEPGRDRRDWKRCRNRVEQGRLRCSECAELLSSHPDVAVRRTLARESGLAREVLEVLLADPDYLVAEYAREASGQEGGAAW